MSLDRNYPMWALVYGSIHELWLVQPNPVIARTQHARRKDMMMS